MSDFEDFDEDMYYEEGDDQDFYSDSGMADEIIDDFDPISSEKPKKKIYETDYLPLSSVDLKDLQYKQIDAVYDIFPMNKEYIKALLMAFRWNRDGLTEALSDTPEEAYKKAGLLNIINNGIHPQLKSMNNFSCFICCSDFDTEVDGIYCSETCCIDCYEMYLEQKINENNVRKLMCPCNCGNVVQGSLLKSVVSEGVFSKYMGLLDLVFVEDNKFIKWCPKPDCQYSVSCQVSNSALSTSIPSVKCLAGHDFCFGCSNDNHMPCLCTYVKEWLKKCEDDSETANWIHANTKECPKCSSTIEKNGGCNHMTCRKCTNEFCWVCMGPWAHHGQAWYNCNRYEESESTDAREKQANSRKNLERYLHYYNRYANHLQSAKLDQDLYARTEEKMEEMQKSSTLSWIEVQFLKSAVDVLVLCRHTLRWTYALGYYLARNNMTYIFESNQQDLELATEALSGLLEEPIDPKTIALLKQKVLDKTNYLNQRRHVLLEDVVQGHSEDKWKYSMPE